MLVQGIKVISNNNNVQKTNVQARPKLQSSYDTVSFQGENVSGYVSKISKILSEILPGGKGKYVKPITNPKGEILGHRYRKGNVSTTYNLKNQKVEALERINGGTIHSTFYPETEILKKKTYRYENGIIGGLKNNSQGQKIKEFALIKEKTGTSKFKLDTIDPETKTAKEMAVRIKREPVNGKTYNDTVVKKYAPKGNVIGESVRNESGYRRFDINPETGEKRIFEKTPQGEVYVTQKNAEGKILESSFEDANGKINYKKYNPENTKEIIKIVDVEPLKIPGQKTQYREITKEVHPEDPTKMIITQKKTGEKSTSYTDNNYLNR